MSKNEDLIYETKRRMLIKYPRFGSEIATSRIEFRDDLKYHTAATDGKNVYVDPNYFASLSEDDRLFLIAHEILHIKFMHPLRLKDKNGNMKDMEIWNEACDAIINANLERDGFTIRDGYVNRPESLNYTAEEFYEILLREKEEQRREQQNEGQQNQKDRQRSGEGQQGQDENHQSEGEGQRQQADNESEQQTEARENTAQNDNSGESENDQENINDTGEKTENGSQGTFSDDHSLWEEAFKEAQSKTREGENSSSRESDLEHGEKSKISEDVRRGEDTDIKFGVDERAEFSENRREKIERFKARKRATDRKIRGDSETINLGDVGEGTNGINWKLLIRKAIESNQTIWSQRRSIAENNYAYRLEENEAEEGAITEVMIDVSGSVQLDLVKAFLRELKPLLKESALKVGCINEKFWGMVDIKNERDINRFTIPKEARGASAWTEDWDLAVRSFSKDKRVNKIVFTDGWSRPENMPKKDLRGENVIWLVYGNENFKPCCGRVINVKETQIKKMHQQTDEICR